MTETAIQNSSAVSLDPATDGGGLRLDRAAAEIALPQAASGVLAILAAPIILAFSWHLSLWEWAILGWACCQLPLSLLPRFGLPSAWLRGIDLLNLTSIVTLVMVLSGGLYSFALAWLLVVPAQAALARDRNFLFSGLAMVAGALSVLTLATVFDGVRKLELAGQDLALLFSLSTGLAVVYAGMLLLSGTRRFNEAQSALACEEQYYRSLSENARDMILRFQSDGELTGVSTASVELLGYRPDEIMRASFADLIHRADRKDLEISLSRASRFGTDTTIVFRMRHRRGHYVWIEMRCRAVPIDRSVSSGGSAQSALQRDITAEERLGRYEIIAVARDISEIKQYQDGLQRARDEAESASQSKSHFLANISHELRTPLNAIIGFSDMMHQEMFGPVGDRRYKEYARIINDSGGHLLDLINDLLDMSKIEAGKFTLNMERLFFPTVIENCLRLVRLQAEQAKVRFAIDLPERMPHIKADPRACRQILLNLLSNAIKFTPPGGTVKVGAHIVGDDLHIYVSDTGVGISPQALMRLGERYEQAGQSLLDDQNDRTLAGTGLGLSLVRSLAELHGGEMHVQSRMGEGTKVSVSIPTRRADIRHQDKQTELPLCRESVIERHMARLEEIEAAERTVQEEMRPSNERESQAVRWPPLRGAA